MGARGALFLLFVLLSSLKGFQAIQARPYESCNIRSSHVISIDMKCLRNEATKSGPFALKENGKV